MRKCGLNFNAVSSCPLLGILLQTTNPLAYPLQMGKLNEGSNACIKKLLEIMRPFRVKILKARHEDTASVFSKCLNGDISQGILEEVMETVCSESMLPIEAV